MPSARVIACLDVRDGVTVKGTRFADLREVGDTVAMAAAYEAQGVDEVVLLDIAASSENRATLLDVARRTAEAVFVPLVIGGGIRTVEGARRCLDAGADKVCLTSPAVERPGLIDEVAAAFGAQCTVANVDARRTGSSWEVRTRMATRTTGLDAVAWATECVERGAGELLVTSIDADGTRAGYDLALIAAVRAAVDVPIIASGGAGTTEHVVEAFRAGADAALLAGVLHDGVLAVADVKAALAAAGLEVRDVATTGADAR